MTNQNARRLDLPVDNPFHPELHTGDVAFMQPRLQSLEFTTSNAVRDALAETGRTEDVRFSPDNRWLVLAGYGLQHLLVLSVRVQKGPTGTVVLADDFMKLKSDGITSAHGVDFIDGRTLAVANRDGYVSIIEIPSGALAGRCQEVGPVCEITGGRFSKMNSPGSIAVRHQNGGKVSLLVCNNYIHRVTQHVVDPARGFQVKSNSVLLERSLNVPDGIAVSRDGRWIAVSNHVTHEILIFDDRWLLGRYSRPVGVLTGTAFPHGLRFTPDDRHLLVADAGSPVINVYQRGSGWAGTRGPLRTTTVLDHDTFQRGRANPAEGGPKGLDIDRSGAVVA
ncbi:MAG TPA: beta-propeller fold lactonase family protein, partial [Xanthomonadales bacterium]|nr:beta-propeller fold lactonase family protein [Xanthomonadales bacterium]